MPIFPVYPDHGEGDWDVPLEAVLDQIVTLLNVHDTKLGLNATGNFVNLVQNTDGTWTMTVT